MNGTTGQEQQIQTVCLLIVSVVAVAVGLYWLRSVMVPFVFAVLIAFGLVPLIDLLIRYLHLPRSIALLGDTARQFCHAGRSRRPDFKLRRQTGCAGRHLPGTTCPIRLTAAMAALPLERFGVQVERTVESLSDISLTTDQQHAVHGDGRTSGPGFQRLAGDDLRCIHAGRKHRPRRWPGIGSGAKCSPESSATLS